MKELTSPYQDKLEFIKNPVIAEFLGMQEDTSYNPRNSNNASSKHRDFHGCPNFLFQKSKNIKLLKVKDIAFKDSILPACADRASRN